VKTISQTESSGETGPNPPTRPTIPSTARGKRQHAARFALKIIEKDPAAP
jgi:hypothetical protein